MRQLTCIEPGKIEWREVPAPALESDAEALVRPLAVARCDIDLFLTSGAFPLRGPFALGHECVAEIVELGDRVRGLEVGQRVVVAFQVSCGRCRACGVGHTANCDEMPTLSDYGMQPLSGTEYGGMLSDLVRVPFAEAMLRRVPAGTTPEALASVADNVVDGYRTVAPHLTERPGSEVLVVAHGIRSIPLYAAQAALALGAARVDVASEDEEVLALAARLGAKPIHTDFSERGTGPYPIVVDCGLTPAGLHYALRSTAPEGVCHAASFYPGGNVEMPLGRMYTLGARFVIGRANSAALVPEILPLIAERRIRPEEVTTRIVDWEDAPTAYLEPAIKLVVRR